MRKTDQPIRQQIRDGYWLVVKQWGYPESLATRLGSYQPTRRIDTVEDLSGIGAEVYCRVLERENGLPEYFCRQCGGDPQENTDSGGCYCPPSY